MQDIRIYSYEAGSLRKVRRAFHKHKSLVEAKMTIQNMRTKLKSESLMKSYRNTQFVITEFYGIYDSKILEIL